MSLISTRALSKMYGRRVGIDGVELDIEQGQVFGFLGPNGSGKTTTIRVLLGFLRASRGRAAIFGLDCWRGSPQIKRSTGYLPGDLRLYPWLTAASALRIFGRVRGIDLRRSGAELAGRFGLEVNLPVRKMSRGMRQKLGLILTLAHDPQLVILDEPTSGLDPLMRHELAACLRELASRGRTIFFSSHTLSEVEQICDRVAIVRQGRIVADETLDTLRRRARRSVRLVFEDATAAGAVEPPAFLSVPQRNGRLWRCELTGKTRDLVCWAAGQPIEDLSVSEPDLQSLFQRFYQSEEETGGCAAC